MASSEKFLRRFLFLIRADTNIAFMCPRNIPITFKVGFNFKLAVVRVEAPADDELAEAVWNC